MASFSAMSGNVGRREVATHCFLNESKLQLSIKIKDCLPDLYSAGKEAAHALRREIN